MPTWVNTAIGTLATACICDAIVFLKNTLHKQKEKNAGLKALLHDRIFTICGECEKKTFATI